MTCDTEWTFRILDVNRGDPFEIRPVQMSLKFSRNELDFCRAKFPTEVGEMMKPETRYADGRLRQRKIVEAVEDGDVVRRLMFTPDNVNYGRNYTHIKFIDLQNSLDDGVVDKHWTSVTLTEAYKYVFQKATNSLIEDIVFTVGGQAEQILLGQGTLSTFTVDDESSLFTGIEELAPFAGKARKVLSPGTVKQVEEDEMRQLSDSYFAVDFNKVSPLKAIARLNKKFGVQTWVDKNGSLYVGSPETNPVRHIAAPDDERVWRYKEDPQISHPRDPVKSVIVEGSFIDEPGYGTLEDIDGWMDDDPDTGLGDFVSLGYARRTDVEEGQTLTVKNTKAKRDALPNIATSILREKMKQQNNGTVEIDTSLSGEEVTELQSVQPGDLLHMVPEDEPFENPTATSGQIGDQPDFEDYCGGYTNNEVYLVDEVEHNVTDSGNWIIFLDVVMYPDNPISSSLAFFDPADEEYYTEEEAFDTGFLLEDT